MSDDTPTLPDSLRAKFPNLRPIKRAPVLMRINGIGLGMYGRRDFDPETNTYVKTYCFCLVFIPVLALAAYRVVDADRGWHFIGREPLSSFAKSSSFGLVLLSLLLAATLTERAYKSSPEYRARHEMRRAAQMLSVAQPMQAAAIYRDIALGSTSQAEAARRGLHDCVEQCLNSASLDQVHAGYRMLAALPPRLNSPQPLLPNSYQRGMTLVEKFRANDPDGTVDLLRQVAAVSGETNDTVKSLEVQLLKAAISARSDSTNRVVELALIYEANQMMDECYALLSPYRAKLGASEGARILGQHLIDEAQYEEAYGLLHPYVQSKLAKLRVIEMNYTNTMSRLYNLSINDLNEGKADRSFYAAYEKASKDQKSDLVDEYVQKRIRNDPAFKRAIADLTAANAVVHVTLDLGMVQLNRAQNLADPAARKAEIEEAEKTFLAIRGLAGNTDQYRLFLGQVYYWLGKSKEGAELFAQLLAAHKRDYPLLMQLARTLREVGDESQARDLTEEAYRTAKRDEDRYSAAALRTHLNKDIDDQIVWLEKCDPTDATTQIDLNCARANKALSQGNRDGAANYLRQAIQGYKNLAQTSTTLNNCGVAYLDLYLATGDLNDHSKGLALIEQALSLAPGDSVLLMNITHLFIQRAYMDVVAGSIRFGILKETPDHDMLWHLCKDETSHAALIQQLRQNEHMKKGLAYLDKALLVAPKNAGLYNLGIHLHAVFHDVAELEKLQQRMRVAEPDLTLLTRQAREAYDPAKDKERRDRLQTESLRFQTLLGTSAVKEHPLTMEFAQVSLNELGQKNGIDGAPVDARKLLAEAAAIYQQVPTGASLAGLIEAQFFCAHDQLKRQSPQYAELAERTRRALSPRELFALLLDRNDTLSAVVRQSPEVRKALELLKEHARLFPSIRQPDEWGLFRTIDATESDLVVQKLNANPAGRLADELRFQLNPLSGTSVLKKYWNARLANDHTTAAAVYQQALRDGVPLPPL